MCKWKEKGKYMEIEVEGIDKENETCVH